jgi:dTDP-N-acetylfucosamine:lipid II N-acetylfucosaminyltransferase
MIIHFISDSIYTRNFIEFVNSYFDPRGHFFVIYGGKESSFNEFYINQPNCQLSKSALDFILGYKKIKNSSRIVIHQLNNIKLMLFILFCYHKAFDKIIWVIWGGDLYFYKICNDSFYNRFIESIRKVFIRRLRYISSYIFGDYKVSKKVYNHSAQYVKSWYPGTIDFDFVQKFEPMKSSGKFTKILAGNSADPNNNHLEIFEILSKFSNSDIHIYVILSYGGELQYINEVKLKGRSLFKDKITFIDDYMSKDEYFDFLKNVDICVFNHYHQQGLGNINLLLCIYKKVYIQSITTPYNYYREMGVHIFDTDEIQNSSFSDFIYLSESDAESNKQKMLQDLDSSTILKNWKSLFYGDR